MRCKGGVSVEEGRLCLAASGGERSVGGVGLLGKCVTSLGAVMVVKMGWSMLLSVGC